MAAAPSKASDVSGQPLEYTTVVRPGTFWRHFWSSRQPARNSCSPEPWLRLPATSTIFLSAAREPEPASRQRPRIQRRVLIVQVYGNVTRYFNSLMRTFLN